MATPWCEFCAVEMLIFMAVCANAAQAMPRPRTRPAASRFNFMGGVSCAWTCCKRMTMHQSGALKCRGFHGLLAASPPGKGWGEGLLCFESLLVFAWAGSRDFAPAGESLSFEWLRGEGRGRGGTSLFGRRIGKDRNEGARILMLLASEEGGGGGGGGRGGCGAGEGEGEVRARDRICVERRRETREWWRFFFFLLFGEAKESESAAGTTPRLRPSSRRSARIDRPVPSPPPRGEKEQKGLLPQPSPGGRASSTGNPLPEREEQGQRLLHPHVVRPAAAFRRDPDDVLRRVLDVAGLAVHAVLRVDLQPRLAAFVPARTRRRRPGNSGFPARRSSGRLIVRRHRGVLQGQVRGLVLLVVGVADEHRGEPVEGELAVRLRDRRSACSPRPA